eukprot:m.17314 g.17314  ORF g.17314 m.17314 type:complete len:106 (-) comp3580_c0_seq1:1469-1786(-)
MAAPADCAELLECARYGELPEMLELLDAGVPVDFQDESGNTGEAPVRLGMPSVSGLEMNPRNHRSISCASARHVSFKLLHGCNCSLLMRCWHLCSAASRMRQRPR